MQLHSLSLIFLCASVAGACDRAVPICDADDSCASHDTGTGSGTEATTGVCECPPDAPPCPADFDPEAVCSQASDSEVDWYCCDGTTEWACTCPGCGDGDCFWEAFPVCGGSEGGPDTYGHDGWPATSTTGASTTGGSDTGGGGASSSTGEAASASC